jgi:3-oxoacyl-[acyl-carrier protein] reductase
MGSEIGMRPGDEFAGQVALVTGGARNIGRAISRALAAGGAAVMVNANTSREAGEETVAMIEKAGGRAALCMGDITDPQAVQHLVDETVKKFGRLDMVVSNAAIRAETPFERIPFDEWKRVISIVLDGAFLVSQAALPHLLKAGGGSLVYIGGMTGHKGALHRAHVVAAKGGLAAMTKAVAHDLADRNITVNCVVPGPIDTVRGLPGAPERPDHRKTLPLVGRRGEPQEIAAMVRMLCGPDARYITGQSIHINGGVIMP